MRESMEIERAHAKKERKQRAQDQQFLKEILEKDKLFSDNS
jgi:hypothetical protein